MGIEAKLDFIIERETKKDNYTFDEFLNMINWKLGELNLKEIEKLKEYYDLKTS